MWNVLLMFGYFGVIGCLGVLLYSIFDELFGLGISVVVVGIGLAVFCFYANSQYNIEKIDELKTKCFLELDDKNVIWNVGTGVVTININGAEMTLNVSDFKIKFGNEVYTPANMDCFRSNK